MVVQEGQRVSTSFNYQRFYDRVARIYAIGMPLIPMWRHYVQQVLPWLPSTGTILEIGPGPGWLLAQLAERYPLAVGLDLSPRMIREAQSHLHHVNLPAPLAQGDATHLPFATDSFGGLAITFTFSAIPDGRAAMTEIARVLCPGGVVALVDAGIPSDGNPIGVGLARLWELFGDLRRDEATLMQEAGLDIIERREFGDFNGIRLVVGRKLSDASSDEG